MNPAPRIDLELYEDAARILCKKRGHDPEESKKLPHPTIEGAFTTVYRWQAAAEELIDFSMCLTSLKEAAEAKAKKAAAKGKPN